MGNRAVGRRPVGDAADHAQPGFRPRRKVDARGVVRVVADFLGKDHPPRSIEAEHQPLAAGFMQAKDVVGFGEGLGHGTKKLVPTLRVGMQTGRSASPGAAISTQQIQVTTYYCQERILRCDVHDTMLLANSTSQGRPFGSGSTKPGSRMSDRLVLDPTGLGKPLGSRPAPVAAHQFTSSIMPPVQLQG